MKALCLLLVTILVSIGLDTLGILPHSRAETINPVSQVVVFATGYESESLFYRKLNLIYTEAFKMIGVPFKLVSLPKERALVTANRGLVDGDASRIKALEEGGEFPNLIRVDVVVNRSFQVAFAKDKNFSVKSWNDIKQQGLVVGYPRGQVYAPAKIMEAQIADHKIIVVNDCWQLLHMLRVGRIDIYVDNIGNCRKHRSQFGDIGIVGKLDEDLGFPYIHKKHKELIPKLVASLNSVLSDPTIKQHLALIESQNSELLQDVQPPNK